MAKQRGKQEQQHRGQRSSRHRSSKGDTTGSGDQYRPSFPVNIFTNSKALYAVDELTGFVVACALVRPTKSLLDLPLKSIMKKLKDKAFCRAIDRDHLRTAAEEIDVPFRDHVENVLSALQGIASELSLAGTE